MPRKIAPQASFARFTGDMIKVKMMKKKFRKINNFMFVSPLDSGMPSFDLKQHNNNNMMLWLIVKSLLEILRRRVSSKWSYCEAFVVKLGENRGAANRKRHQRLLDEEGEGGVVENDERNGKNVEIIHSLKVSFLTLY